MRGRRGTKPLEPGAVHSSNSVYIVCVYESECRPVSAGSNKVRRLATRFFGYLGLGLHPPEHTEPLALQAYPRDAPCEGPSQLELATKV